MKKATPKDTDYSAYVGVGHNRPSDMVELSKLVEKTYDAQVKVEKLEADLKEAKEELRQLSEKRLPEKMDEIGVADYTTSTGIYVEVREKVRGSLPVENKSKGFDWLEKNGYEGLIEMEVVVPYKRGELSKAQELVKELNEGDRIASLERNVHHARLDGFIREQLAQGKDIPLDIFGVYRQRVAKVEV